MSQEIYITRTDKVKLLDIIDKAANKELRTDANLKALEAEIYKARVVDQEGAAHVFVKMNSKVIMSIDQEEEEITLTYPEDADRKKNKISVLSPIGTAILGYCEGSTVEWRVPGGTVHIQIQRIID